MRRETNQLLVAAQGYIRRGISVVPCVPMVPGPRRSGWRKSWMCACGDQSCVHPGTHRLTANPIDDPATAELTWAAASRPGLLICSGPKAAVWHVPLVVGSHAMRRLEQLRLDIWPPVMQLPNRDWVICTDLPRNASWSEKGIGGLRLVTENDPVLAPPSRGPAGKAHWIWARRFPSSPLPAAEPVLAALHDASTVRSEVSGDRRGLDPRSSPAW